MARSRYVWRKFVCSANETHDLIQGLVVDGSVLMCPCGAPGRRPDAAAPKSPTVIGDELWGGPRFIENIDTEPVFVSTKSEYRALLASKGFENRVRHVPVPGTDKSPFTTSWITGPPPGVDPRPWALLSDDERVERRRIEAIRLGFTEAELEAFGANLESAGAIAGVEGIKPTAEFYPDR